MKHMRPASPATTPTLAIEEGASTDPDPWQGEGSAHARSQPALVQWTAFLQHMRQPLACQCEDRRRR